MDQPIAFQIFEAEEGGKVATNGVMRLQIFGDEGAQVRLRRAVKGLPMKPPAERVLPELNKLAGEVLAKLDMPAHELRGRLAALQGLVPDVKPQAVEWAYAELDGVRVYVDGVNVVLTRRDLAP